MGFWGVQNAEAYSYTQDTDAPRTPSLSLTSDAANNRIEVSLTGSGDTGATYPDAAIELDETGLVGHWKMDGDFTDSSGKGNNGTGSGGVTATADGQIKQAGNFDGVDDFVDAGNGSSLNITNAITFEAWIYRTRSGTEQYIMSLKYISVSRSL